MKKVTLLVILAILLCARASANDIELPHITVFGTSVAKVSPNEMQWDVLVRNRSQTLEIVAKEHIDIVMKVTTFLKASAVKEEDLQTSRMAFGENWEYKNRSRIKEGYYALTHITFTLAEFDNYEKIWLGLSRISNVSIRNVFYDHTERIKHQDETRVKALIAAKEKADTLAKAIGSEIAEPLLIEELWAGNDVEHRPNALRVAERSPKDGKGIPLSPGQIQIRMRVKVSFRLITHDQ